MGFIRTDKAEGRVRNRAIKDHTGIRYGRLVAVSLVERDPKWGDHKWLFRCDCGGVKTASVKLVKSGHTQSCGCLFSEALAERNTTHGLSKVHPQEYRVWKGMRRRCSAPTCRDYPDYGGRGITVCPEWDSFEQFFSDMGPKRAGLSIERIDVDKGYSPGNCRWADKYEQARNRRSNHLISMLGVEKTLQEWCSEIGIEPSKVRYRLKQGWPAEKAFSKCDHRKPNL